MVTKATPFGVSPSLQVSELLRISLEQILCVFVANSQFFSRLTRGRRSRGKQRGAARPFPGSCLCNLLSVPVNATVLRRGTDTPHGTKPLWEWVLPALFPRGNGGASFPSLFHLFFSLFTETQLQLALYTIPRASWISDCPPQLEKQAAFRDVFSCSNHFSSEWKGLTAGLTPRCCAQCLYTQQTFLSILFNKYLLELIRARRGSIYTLEMPTFNPPNNPFYRWGNGGTDR